MHQASEKNCVVHGENTVSKSAASKCFACFHFENFNVKDEFHSSRPKTDKG